MRDFYNKQSAKSVEKKRQTFWQVLFRFFHLSPENRNAGEFLIPVRRLAYELDFYLRLDGFPAPSDTYQPYSFGVCQETNEKDCNKADCRICEEQIIHLIFPQMLVRMLRGVHRMIHHQLLYCRIRSENNLLSNSNTRQDWLSLLPFAKNVFQLASWVYQYFLGYNFGTFQTSSLICQALGVTSVAGQFDFSNYTIKGVH